MASTTRLAILTGILALLPSVACADLVAYIDEGEFLAALSSQGYSAVAESFEDDSTWGSVRTSIAGGQHTATSITSLGVQWTANNAHGGATTGSGPARSGDYGPFTLPHGDETNNTKDGWIGNAVGPKLVAVGGWIETNTPPADLGMTVDGVDVDFGELPNGAV